MAAATVWPRPLSIAAAFSGGRGGSTLLVVVSSTLRFNGVIGLRRRGCSDRSCR